MKLSPIATSPPTVPFVLHLPSYLLGLAVAILEIAESTAPGHADVNPIYLLPIAVWICSAFAGRLQP